MPGLPELLGLDFMTGLMICNSPYGLLRFKEDCNDRPLCCLVVGEPAGDLLQCGSGSYVS